MLAPNLAPMTCDNRKYTPPLSILHCSHTPIALSAAIRATDMVSKITNTENPMPALPYKHKCKDTPLSWYSVIPQRTLQWKQLCFI